MMNVIKTTLILLISCLFFIELEAQTVEPYPDNSWDLETYVYLGIPSIDKKWEKKELKQCIKYMQKIYLEDRWSLPRKNSVNSGQLFKKMTSLEILELINNKTVPIEERIDYINLSLEYGNFLASIYQEKSADTERFGEELLASYLFLTHSSASVCKFMVELKLRLPFNVTQQPEFEKMTKQSVQQLYFMMNLLVLTLEEDTLRYDRTILSDFAKNATQTIVEKWSLINKIQQTGLLKRMKNLKKHTNLSVRKQIKKTVKLIENG